MLTTEHAESIAAQNALIAALERMIHETEARINQLWWRDAAWAPGWHCTDPARHAALRARISDAKRMIADAKAREAQLLADAAMSQHGWDG